MRRRPLQWAQLPIVVVVDADAALLFVCVYRIQNLMPSTHNTKYYIYIYLYISISFSFYPSFFVFFQYYRFYFPLDHTFCLTIYIYIYQNYTILLFQPPPKKQYTIQIIQAAFESDVHHEESVRQCAGAAAAVRRGHLVAGRQLDVRLHGRFSALCVPVRRRLGLRRW